MVKKPRKTRWSVTLTPHFADRVKKLVDGGIFLNRGEVIRGSLKLMFEKYGINNSEDPQ